MSQLAGIDHWVCGGNQLADAEATGAIAQLPRHVVEAQSRAHAEVLKSACCYKDMIDHMVRVGRQSVNHGKQTYGQQGVQGAVECDHPVLDLKAVVRTIRYKVPQVLHTRDMAKWMEWFRGLDNEGLPVKLVSWIELLVHYQATTGCVGMICRGRGQHRQWQSVALSADVDFGTLQRGFCQYGWNMIRLFSPVWRTIHARPHFYRVQFWTSCIPIRVDSGFESIIDGHFSACNMGMLASAKDVAKLPCAMPA